MRVPQHLQKVVDNLWQPVEGESPGNVYAILDAARDDRIYPEIQASDIKSECLYKGEQACALAEVAPYLVQLQKEDPFTLWLLGNGFKKSWGIFLVSNGDFEKVIRHFRQFIFVKNENGDKLYFRFYDPRVLRVFLPTCRLEEAQQFFGPVDCFLGEDKPAGEFLNFTCTDVGVEENIINFEKNYVRPNMQNLRDMSSSADNGNSGKVIPVMIIRKEQMKVFSDYMVQQFEDQMVDHLREKFPEKMNGLTEPDLCSMIKAGIEKAAKYDVTIEDDVQRYLEYMMIYGVDFDIDSKIPWAGNILDTENVDGSVKMEQLDRYFRRMVEVKYGWKQ